MEEEKVVEHQARVARRLRAIWDAKRRDARARGESFTQEEIAARIGITQGMFGHYLSGRHRLPPMQCLKIADVLGVAVEEIDPEWTFADTDLANVTVADLSIFSQLMSLPDDLRRQAVEHIAALTELHNARGSDDVSKSKK